MEDSDPIVTAERIVWGKFLNVGQTCGAPDHLFVHKNIENRLIQALIKAIRRFYGPDPQSSRDYGRIINSKHFDRLMNYLNDVKIISGGQHDRNDLYIAPTLVNDVFSNEHIMHEEIFGLIRASTSIMRSKLMLMMKKGKRTSHNISLKRLLVRREWYMIRKIIR